MLECISIFCILLEALFSSLHMPINVQVQSLISTSRCSKHPFFLFFLLICRSIFFQKTWLLIFIPIPINQVKYLSHSLFQESKELIVSHFPNAFSLKFLAYRKTEITFIHLLTLKRSHITNHFKRCIKKDHAAVFLPDKLPLSGDHLLLYKFSYAYRFTCANLEIPVATAINT